MSALSPWFLLAGASVAIPVFLHLFHRRRTRRLSFPALRYLERTEREHAREIRLRQLLLLLARVGLLVLLVAAGARLVLLDRGAAHPPTAVAVVLDNSMSSGLVVGDRRVLDELKDVAERALDLASAEDRFWVVRAGSPWLPAVPGTADQARAIVRATEPTGARGDLTAALQRAADLVRTSGFPSAEVHLVSDLQRTALDPDRPPPTGSVPLVVWAPDGDTRENGAIVEVLVGRGLPPLLGQRTELTVRTLDGTDADEGPMTVRAVVDGRFRGAATVPPGSEATIPLPPSGSGWVTGFVERDPDALSLDDRRFFAFRSRPAPTLSVAGDAGLFVREALAVLEGAGRVRRVGTAGAGLIVSVGGVGLGVGSSAVLVVPPSDPTLLPALDRRLAEVGVPWSYRARPALGSADLDGSDVPEPLRDVRVDRWFELVADADAAVPSEVLAEAAGDPWAVATSGAAGRPVLLLASPLDPASSSLPVSAGLVRFLDWVANEWAGQGGSTVSPVAGERLSAPAQATHVRFPGGEVSEIDGTRSVAATGEVGLYTFLAGDSAVAIVAVNPAEAESDLSALDARSAERILGPEAALATDPDAWRATVYRDRSGSEVWWPLLIAAALLMLAESMLAAGGGPRAGRSLASSPLPTQPESHGLS